MTGPKIRGAELDSALDQVDRKAAQAVVRTLAPRVVLAGDKEDSDSAEVLELALGRVDQVGPGLDSDPSGRACLPRKCCSNISTKRKRES